MIELKIEKIVVEPIETNCYLILLNNELAVVDPGGEADKIIVEIEKSFSRHSRGGGNSNLILSKYILLTHGHYDHVMAINDLKKKYGFKVVISEKDKDIEGINLKIGIQTPEIKPDILAEGATLFIGEKEIQVIETPGHTKGSVCYLVNGSLFSGDTMFHHSHGRTDLPGGSDAEMKKSLKKLMELNNNIKVYPGHGPETTIGEERKYNG